MPEIVRSIVKRKGPALAVTKPAVVGPHSQGIGHSATTMETRNALTRRSERFAGRSTLRVRSCAQAATVVGLVIAMSGAVFGYPWQTPPAQAVSNEPWFSGYVDVTTTPTFEFDAPVSDAERDVVLSFIVADPHQPCTPTWATSYTLDDADSALRLNKRIDRLRRGGGAVAVSFGGSLNEELAAVCTNPDDLAAAYRQVIDRYRITTIDLDIEGYHITDHAAGARRAQAIKVVQSSERSAGTPLAVWLTLPVSPAGLDDDGQVAVTQMLRAGVDIAGVNAMTMNYGESRHEGQSMLEASRNALTATHAQLKALYAAAGTRLSEVATWRKLGVTPMIGQNDMPGEVFSLDDAKSLNAFVVARGVGRVSMWSLNRDMACPSDHVDVSLASHACSGVEQGELRFADTLSAGLNGSFARAAGIETTGEPRVRAHS